MYIRLRISDVQLQTRSENYYKHANFVTYWHASEVYIIEIEGVQDFIYVNFKNLKASSAKKIKKKIRENKKEQINVYICRNLLVWRKNIYV